MLTWSKCCVRHFYHDGHSTVLVNTMNDVHFVHVLGQLYRYYMDFSTIQHLKLQKGLEFHWLMNHFLILYRSAAVARL